MLCSPCRAYSIVENYQWWVLFDSKCNLNFMQRLFSFPVPYTVEQFSNACLMWISLPTKRYFLPGFSVNVMKRSKFFYFFFDMIEAHHPNIHGTTNGYLHTWLLRNLLNFSRVFILASLSFECLDLSTLCSKKSKSQRFTKITWCW